jgi:hypothetical protein
MEAAVSRHRILALTLAAVIGLLGAGGAPAEARQSPGPIVDIQSAAGLAPDGQSITVQLLASCPERWAVVEAIVVVSQSQASGQGSFPLTCIGSLRPFAVTVRAAGGTFQLGDAQANASVVISRGRTERAQDAEVIDVQPTVFVDLGDTARLESGGGAVLIDITAACPVGANGQQSYVNISQGQTSGNGSYVPVCDGRSHTFTVRVLASQGAFQAGTAQALTFANVEHEGIGFSGVDESPVQIVLTAA